MESRLGADLGSVRVHTGPQADASARALGARAYTVGQDIVFGNGEYRPDSHAGRHLLAHELSHTIQQGNGSRAPAARTVSRPGDPDEREAEAAAHAAVDAKRPRTAPLVQPAVASAPRVQGAWYDVVVESAEWVGGKVASGAEAAWEGAEWVGGKVASAAEATWEGAQWVGGKVASGAEAAWKGARWLGGKAIEETKRIGGAAWACAKSLGRTLLAPLTFNFTSLTDLVGVPKPVAESAPGILESILSVARHPCVQMVPGYTLLAGIVAKLSGIRGFIAGAWRVMQNPELILDAIRDSVGAMVAQVPARAQALTRAAITFSDPSPEHLDGIWRHLEPKLQFLASNWWEVIKSAGEELLWPWPGVWKDLGEIWDHLKGAAEALWDLEFSDAVDHLLAVWRKANEAIGRLYGWFLLASILVGAIIGAIFGVGVGAGLGAVAGAKFALAVGEALLISTIAAETATIGKAGIDLVFRHQTEEEQEEDYEQIANSGLTLAITGAMFALGVLAARFARAVIGRVAARVWRRPALRGRGVTARGDIIELRVALAARVTALLRRRAVTWLESIRRNFPVIDLLEGGQIRITPRKGRAPLYEVRGGRLISVKSTATVGAGAEAAIRGWVDELANFTTVRNVSVTNPSGRTLIVAVQTPLDDATLAALRLYASARGVTIEVFTNLPPNHPAVVFPDAIPSIMTEAGVVVSAEATEAVPAESE